MFGGGVPKVERLDMDLLMACLAPEGKSAKNRTALFFVNTRTHSNSTTSILYTCALNS